jgi:hypothetical protein
MGRQSGAPVRAFSKYQWRERQAAVFSVYHFDMNKNVEEHGAGGLHYTRLLLRDRPGLLGYLRRHSPKRIVVHAAPQLWWTFDALFVVRLAAKLLPCAVLVRLGQGHSLASSSMP